MFAVDHLILLAAVLIILGIASSKLSSRMGLPVLVLFLLVGMLAGEEGLGGIVFESYALAHAVGTVALALILFDGGPITNAPICAPALVNGGLLPVLERGNTVTPTYPPIFLESPDGGARWSQRMIIHDEADLQSLGGALLPYNTGKDSSASYPETFTWYDDLVVSRNRIADPAP